MNSAISTVRMLALVLDALPVRVFWKDTQSRLLGCNQGFADDAGVSNPSELVGRTHFEFYPPDQAEAYRADDIEVMSTGRAKLAIEERLLLQSGKTIWVETNKLPLQGADGAVIGLLATYIDISQRHAVAQDLARLVEELTIARDVAVAAAAAKSRFVENVSHELRAPLETIVSAAESILRNGGGANASEANDILETARDLLDLSGDILAVSKFAEEHSVDHERGRAVSGVGTMR